MQNVYSMVRKPSSLGRYIFFLNSFIYTNTVAFVFVYIFFRNAFSSKGSNNLSSGSDRIALRIFADCDVEIT